MKKQFLFSLIFIFNLSLCFSQKYFLDGVYLESDVELSAKIDGLRKLTDAQLGSFVEIRMAQDSLGFRDAWFDGKELRLVTVFSKQNFEYKKANWYFYKGRLIYAESFISDKEDNRILAIDEKYYLDNEHLFKWMQGDQQVEKNSVNFTKAANGIAEQALKLKMENKN